MIAASPLGGEAIVTDELSNPLLEGEIKGIESSFRSRQAARAKRHGALIYSAQSAARMTAAMQKIYLTRILAYGSAIAVLKFAAAATLVVGWDSRAT
jgi:hypothetical protein